jgi:transcriptional regulator with XRE-family HTH domain
VQREEIQKRLGARIRKLRKAAGFTQDEFADLSGLHRAQVGAFENGRMNITLASLHLIAQTLGIRIIDLFKGVERGPAHRKDSPKQKASE